MAGHHFISYSGADANEFALKLHDALEAGPPHVPTWLDKRDIIPGQDWDREIEEAIRSCSSMLFVMSDDSVEDGSVCKHEWSRALRYKKPVVPLLYRQGVIPPFRLESRQYIDFTGSFDQALAWLRNHLSWLDSPAGVLRAMEDRLADAKHDLRRSAGTEQEARIRDEMAHLEAQIGARRRIAADPEGAAKQTEESIARGLERERQPSQPVGGVVQTRFLNPPPAVAPTYFQNRHVETLLIGEFVKNESKRLMTVIGRAGIGKTATVCRVLRALEGGRLPDEGGPLEVSGIIYLSGISSRQINAPNLYEDLIKLLPTETARKVDSIVRNPNVKTEARMRTLLDAFPGGRTLVLLDNFEDVVDPDTHGLTDAELAEALRALLTLPHHGVKVILTTRVAPRDLTLVQPGRQGRLDLDGGLESPYAENILREMDADGKLGLKSAPDELLDLARERTRGFPRALEALFAILSADRHTTLKEVLNTASTLLPENVTAALVGDAFSRLDLLAQRVMQALAVFGRPVPPVAVDFLLQPHQPSIDSAPVLNRLVNMHFARKDAGRYYLHPVDREYALSRLAPGEVSDREVDGPAFTRYGLLHRAAEYFGQARLPRASWRTIEDLVPQLAEFDLRYAGQDYDTAAGVLLGISQDYLQRWGWSRLVVDLLERLLDKIDDTYLNATMLTQQGHNYLDLGRIDRAINCFEQALAINREVGNRVGEGGDVGGLGQASAALGQHERAITYYEQALHIDREVGNRRGEAIRLSDLGWSYADLGQFERALAYYEEALDIKRELGDRLESGITLANLGLAYAALGQFEQAIGLNEQALNIAREVGDRRGEGIRLGNLGKAHNAEGQFERAIEHHEQDLAIAREIGDRRGEGYALFDLAQALNDEERHHEATRRAMEAVRIGRETADPTIASCGNFNLALARLYVGDLLGARVAAEAARHHDVARNNHSVLAVLGLISLRQGDRAAAAREFSAAISHADVMLERCAKNFEALDAKGLALAGLAVMEGGHHAAEAIVAFRAARAITKAPGIVGRVRKLLNLLAPSDTANVLARVCEAADNPDEAQAPQESS